MKQLIMLKGLPASGKSTRAKEQVANNQGKYKRINKDELRAMLDEWRRSKLNETIILQTRDFLIGQGLFNWFNVIVDDTNLDPKHEAALKALAKIYKAKFVVKYFDIIPQEAIKRDEQRTNPVWSKVIRDMYNRYIKPTLDTPTYTYQSPDLKLPNAIICDIDGTLADNDHRSPYDTNLCEEDWLIVPVKMIIDSIHESFSVILMSGRSEEFREQTEKRLDKHWVSYTHLYMRPQWNTRPDTVTKQELYEQHIKWKYNVLFAVDDRIRIVDMRRSLGIFTFDVNQTREEY